jgi:hypothetical protein
MAAFAEKRKPTSRTAEGQSNPFTLMILAAYRSAQGFLQRSRPGMAMNAELGNLQIGRPDRRDRSASTTLD